MRPAIATALALACKLALSQPPIPSGRERIQPPQASASNAASQAIAEQRGTANVPLFVQSVPSPENEEDAAHKKYERYEKPSLDRRITIGTELLALFTFLLFCFTAALWLATRRLVKDADKSAKQQLRAYVGVKRAWIAQGGPYIDSPVFAQVCIVNAGQTAAHNARVALHFERRPHVNGDFPLVFNDFSTYLQPGFEWNVIQAATDADSKALWAAPLDITKSFFVISGEVTYEDAFGEERSSQFRFKQASAQYVNGKIITWDVGPFGHDNKAT